MSSAPVFNNTNFYYISYLFNSNPTAKDHGSYWLTSSVGNQTLTITFPTPQNLERIRVCATSCDNNSVTDRCSNYAIYVTTGNGKQKTITDGFVDTRKDMLGLFHEHPVREVGVLVVVFTLTQEKKWGVTLKELEFYVVQLSSPSSQN